MEIIGHRGASFDAPENTLASFQMAWEQGADAIECDVRLTKDGQIVVIHDADTLRTAGVNRFVTDQRLDQLRQLDVGGWKGERFSGEKIPTLEDVLRIVPSGKRAFIEVKCGTEIVPELKRVFAASGLHFEQLVVISFSADVVVAVKRELPKHTVYWCADLNSRQSQAWTPEELIARASLNSSRWTRSIGASRNHRELRTETEFGPTSRLHLDRE